MHVFNHKPLTESLPELTASYTKFGRVYLTPDGEKYPSITTVLSILSRKFLQEWRQRVGEAEANRISKAAASRGTSLHSVIEYYLNNQKLPADFRLTPTVKLMFQRMRPLLHKIDNIVAQEIPLYSDELMVAGRCDTIAEYNGKLSIIDFKSSTKAKKKDWISNYFYQTTAYALMFEERTGIPIEQIVVLIGCEEDYSAQEFVEQKSNYIQPLQETIHQFFGELAAA